MCEPLTGAMNGRVPPNDICFISSGDRVTPRPKSQSLKTACPEGLRCTKTIALHQKEKVLGFTLGMPTILGFDVTV